ncbi:hypothetical protein H2248_011729 [Termitomyces sp. 'cryptogamus']|nr:hypothetical protein H2248_011729 [Termitomyces sp. 'cryptogamus']
MHHSRNFLHLWRFWWRDARLGELPPTTLPQSHCPKSNDITTYTFPCPTTFLPVPYHIDTTLPSLLTHIVPSVRLPRSVGIVAPSVPSQGMDFDFSCSGQPTQTKEAIIQSDGLLLYVRAASYESGTSPLSSWVPIVSYDGPQHESPLDLFERLLRRRMAHTGAEGRLELLPNVLSYSPLSIPILTTDHSSPPIAKDVTLFRRDLFDAPFQLIAQENITEDTSEAPSTSTGVNALAFVEAPFDLVPGIYEGGVKTWECSIDLAGVPGGPPPQTRCTRKTYHRDWLWNSYPHFIPPPTGLFLPTGGSNRHKDYNASVLELVSFSSYLCGPQTPHPPQPSSEHHILLRKQAKIPSPQTPTHQATSFSPLKSNLHSSHLWKCIRSDSSSSLVHGVHFLLLLMTSSSQVRQSIEVKVSHRSSPCSREPQE